MSDARTNPPATNPADDPRLTAYALGEGTPEERAAVEALLASDPAARAEVDAIRAAAAGLEGALRAGPVPSLDPARTGALEEAIGASVPAVPVPPRSFSGLWVGLPAAAVLVLGLAVASRAPSDAGRDVAAARGATPLTVVDMDLDSFDPADGTLEFGAFIPEEARISVRGSTVPPAYGGAGNAGGGRGGESWTGAAWDAAKGGKPEGKVDPQSTVYGFGGGGGGGGHLYRGPAGVVPPSSAAFKNAKDWYFKGVGGGGTGAGGNSRYHPDAGARPRSDPAKSFNDSADGDYRGRTENVISTVNLLEAYDPATAGAGTDMVTSTDGQTWYRFGIGAGKSADGKEAPVLLYTTQPVEIARRVKEINGAFNYRVLTLKPGIQITMGGALPASLLSLKDIVVDGDALPAGVPVAAQVDPAALADVTARSTLQVNFAMTGAAVDAAAQHESSVASFGTIVENAFIRPKGDAALSTFSIDVDTAAYSILRRFLMEEGRLPPPGIVRLEEMVNYFPYDLAPPTGEEPFAVRVESAAAPWRPEHRLVRIALKGRVVQEAERPAANLVFLLDVSGSMNQPNKLPLVKQSIALLVEKLTARDRIAMVVYAGSSGLVLDSTMGDRKAEILAALDRLSAGGSTNGAAGIELAYKVAAEHFVAGGINRVILATDGDFNVGVSDQGSLARLIEEKAKSKVFLTALGYGMDNLKDTTLETLADKGNGNYGYIDSLEEARKVLVEEGMSTLHAIAKDVKIQVEFNPAKVAAYRLLGYENRMLAAQDFKDDTKDAGEVGAGHAVTALYEIVPAGAPVPGAEVEALKYQPVAAVAEGATEETLTVKVRWKDPEGDVSRPMEVGFQDGGAGFDAASVDFRFAASVAAFGMLLRSSEYRGSITFGAVKEIAASSLGADEGGRRKEFLGLVDKAASLVR